MTDVSQAVESAVESSDLPRRLKLEVYDAIESRPDATPTQAEEIVQAVESKYLETRVDPLDPVGTVSAQSIGEPGTQM
ncbi:MAG: DNA-directed RNA polymerase subunit A'', partial [Natronomonas sp.]